MSEEPTKILKEIAAAIEKQTGQKVEYFTVCSSFEDSPDFQRIANIGISTICEEPRCTSLSVNCCCHCHKAICMEHSHDAIAEGGYDAYACAYCSTETEFQL